MFIIPFIIAVVAWRSFGKKVLGPVLVEAQKINESIKVNFLDNETDIKSAIDVTQKYTGSKKANLLKGSVKIGQFQVGIIPLLIVSLLLIKKLR